MNVQKTSGAVQNIPHKLYTKPWKFSVFYMFLDKQIFHSSYPAQYKDML